MKVMSPLRAPTADRVLHTGIVVLALDGKLVSGKLQRVTLWKVDLGETALM